MTLSSPTGPSGGGNTVIGTAPGSVFPAGTTPTVQFQYSSASSTTCGANAKDVAQIVANAAATTAGVVTVDPATVRRITTSKIAFQVPSGPYPATNPDSSPSTVNATGLALSGIQTSARWNLCVYDSASTMSSTLLANSAYTIAIRPTLTSILPANGPAAGGQSITVNGSGFLNLGTPITGAIDGVALTNIKLATDGASFTATTGAHVAAGGLDLTVVAPGGTVSSLDPANNGGASIPFSYSNGITIAPNTAPAATTVNLDVTGVGFSALRFGTGPATSSDAHVFLVGGAYVSNQNRGVAECGQAAVVSDFELACTLNLAANRLSPADSSTTGTSIAEGPYIVTVVANGDINAGSAANPTIVSSGATFTVGPY
jgi:hypothetical protein